MYKHLENFSLKELIGYSIESEEASARFYSDFAETSVEEIMKERFKSLARDERIHKKALLDIHEKEFGTRDYTIPESEGLPPHESSHDFDDVVNLIDTLEKAMENERNAFRIYQYLAKRYDDHRPIFQYLAIMEKGHYESIKAERDMLEDETIESTELDEKSISNLWAEHPLCSRADKD